MPYKSRWLALVVLLVAGCSAPGPAPAGSVEGVLSPVVLINGSTAAAGDAIPSSATLLTNNSGVLDFLLRGFLTSCQLRPESQITIEAAQQVTIRYVRGEVWCQSATAPQREVVIDVGVRQIRVTRARFGLRDGQILVDSGDVAIASATVGTVERQHVREDHVCYLDAFPAVCASYAPDQRDRVILDWVQHVFDNAIATSATPDVSGEPSVQPPETTKPPNESSEPAQESSEEEPETTNPPQQPSEAPTN